MKSRLRVKNWKRIFLAFVILCSMVLLSACSDSGWELFWDLGLDWATDQGIVNGDSINFGKVSQKVAGDTVSSLVGGDEQNALGAGQVVDDIRTADQLAQDGLDSVDTTKIDEAQRKRPKDWTYQDDQGVLDLILGQEDWARDNFEKAEEKAMFAANNAAGCERNMRNLLQHRIDTLQDQYDKHPVRQGMADEINFAQYELTKVPTRCAQVFSSP